MFLTYIYIYVPLIIVLFAATFRPKNKVSIVGCGQVGLAIAYSLLNRNAIGALALCDIDEEKLLGEAMDLRQGSAF